MRITTMITLRGVYVKTRLPHQLQVLVTRKGQEAWVTHVEEVTLHWTEEIDDIALIAMQKTYAEILCPHIEKIFPDIFFCEEVDATIVEESTHESQIHSGHG